MNKTNTWSRYSLSASSTFPMCADDIRLVYLGFKRRSEEGVGFYGRNRFAIRDFMFIRLLIETGERPGALLKAKLEDFDLYNRLLVIPCENEKTGRPKYYVLTYSLCHSLQEYFDDYKGWISKRDNHVFFSNERRGGGYVHEQHFNHYVYVPLIKSLGLFVPVKWGSRWINKNCLYSIRAGVFTFLHKDCGFSPKEVQQRSQHANLSTLERFYLKYDMIRMQEILANAQASLTREEN